MQSKAPEFLDTGSDDINGQVIWKRVQGGVELSL